MNDSCFDISLKYVIVKNSPEVSKKLLFLDYSIHSLTYLYVEAGAIDDQKT